jgi:hypothetical protein
MSTLSCCLAGQGLYAYRVFQKLPCMKYVYAVVLPSRATIVRLPGVSEVTLYDVSLRCQSVGHPVTCEMSSP